MVAGIRTIAPGAIDIREDVAIWRPISLDIDGVEYRFQPPISGHYTFDPTPGQAHEWLLKAAFQPFGLTVFNVETSTSIDRLNHALVNALVANLMSWIRVMTRQYWLGKQVRPTAEEPAYELSENGKPHHSGGGVNVFRYGRPLASPDWEALGLYNVGATLPDVGLTTFCDGLLAIGNREWRQAMILMASACDQELNFVLERAFVEKAPNFEKLYRKRVRFDFKLGHSDVAEELGLESFAKVEPSAAAKLNRLYEFRGRAIHQKEVTVPPVNPTDYIFAVEKFFAWASKQSQATR
jgi:hypothetical protein